MSRVVTEMRVSGAVNNSEATADSLAETPTASFNLLEHPICLNYPSRIAVSAWIGHVPFAFYLIDVLRPKAIAELGTHYGVSYCAFCQAVKELGLDTRCYAIDSWQGDEQTGFYGSEVLADLEQHHNPLYGGFSQLIQSTFEEAVSYFSDQTFDLLHIDGFHTYEAVKKDFEKWLPKMTDRGIVLLHDINVREREFGVWKFWEEAKNIYPHFEFVHSHGLGVLAVGKHCPEGLKGLFQSSAEVAAKIRSVFSQLGERLELAKELQLIRPVVKELTASQQGKDLQLQENSRQLQEKDTLIHEQNLSAMGLNEKLQASERLLAEKDTLIHQKNLEAIAFNEKLQASDRLLAEKDTLIHHKNLEAIGFNGTLQASHRLLAEKDSLIHEKDLELIALNQQLQEKEQRLVHFNQQLQEKSKELQERDTLVHERNLEAARNSQRIQDREQQLQEKAQLAQQYLQQLKEAIQRQDAKDQLIGSKDLIIQKGKQDIEALGLQLQTEMQKLSELQQQLQLKERQLQLKYRQLHDREYEKNHLAQERDLQLADKEKRLQEFALQLREKLLDVKNNENLIEQYHKACAEFGNSGSYRLGRALTWPVRAVKQQFGRLPIGADTDNGFNQSEAQFAAADIPLQPATAPEAPTDPNIAYDYGLWVRLYDTLTDTDREAILARLETLEYKPLLSILMPVYNVEEGWLRKAIESVRQQLYPYWQLCIADDNSTLGHVRRVLEGYADRDSRIKVTYRTRNGHISAASNSALELASGEFVALLDNDDELPEHALYTVAEELNRHPQADLLYSDEDKINENGERREPNFKSDWNPDLFYSCNMISHLGVYRTEIVRRIGGFKKGYEGSQDYDLALRFIEQISEENIRHIPRVLYHWRAIAGSVALASGEKNYAHEAARKAIRSHLKRKGVEATVREGHNQFHRVSYPMPDPAPMISLIIPTRDRLELLSHTVDGLLNDTDYKPIEILIVDNQSKNSATLKYLREVQSDDRVKVIEYDAPFNYSAINNLGVRESSGKFIGLINNDIKVISPGWLAEMVSHAARSEIGAVGAKLLYHDDTVQHAGVILGVNGVAAHAHRFIPKDSPGYINRAMVIQNLSAVTGACMVMRREVFEEIGGLDEINLPVAFNDIDLCIRLREKGYRIVWTPYAELYHLESASRGRDDTPENAGRFRKEVEYMMHIWAQVLWNDPYYNPNLTMIREDFSLAVPPRVTSTVKRDYPA